MAMTYRGTTALVTGASSGLGAEFAHQLAARGAGVVLVARRADRLAEVAAAIKDRHGVSAAVLPLDLAQPGAGEVLRAELTARGIAVDTLVNNAGFGTYGPFAAEDPATIAREVQLNVAALVDITRAFLPDLLSAGRGGLVNVASTAAYQPTPHMAVYGATKAFVLAFTEALAYEAKGSGLRVLALSPGPTRTEFFDVLGSRNAAVGRFETAEQVVSTALGALDRRATPPSVVSGPLNRLTAAAARLLPRRLTLAVSGRALAG